MTNLKFFEIKVKLMHKDNPDILACAEGNNLEVRAKLLYEDGNPVRTINPNDEPLRGDTEVWVIGGEARLKLRMGEKSLTSMGERKRFRIRIEPRDDAMRQAFPQLSDTGAPLKSVTKLERKPPAASAAPPTPGVAGTPGVSHVATAAPTSSLLTPGAPALGGASISPVHPAGSSLHAPSSNGGAAPQGVLSPNERAEVERLKQELRSEKGTTADLRRVLEEQRKQADMFAARNTELLEKISALEEQNRGVKVERHPSDGADRPAASRRRH